MLQRLRSALTAHTAQASKAKSGAKDLKPTRSRKTLPTDPLQAAILERCETCYQQAELKLGRRFTRPSVSFALRGKSAGTAHLQQNRLRFNPVLLKENPQAFLDEVVPHEIAHLLCFLLYGAGKAVKPHGKEWQAIMIQVFGLPPKTTHSFDISSVKGRTFKYQCLCGPIELSIRRHNKVQQGQSQYLCRHCKQVLTPAE